MGLSYVVFRLWYMFKSKLGLQRIIFPTSINPRKFISLEKWKKNPPPFFFSMEKI